MAHHPSEWEDTYFLRAVEAAASETFRTCARRALPEVYLTLAAELERRGIVPEPEAVFDGAWLISRGRKPAVLRPHPGDPGEVPSH